MNFIKKMYNDCIEGYYIVCSSFEAFFHAIIVRKREQEEVDYWNRARPRLMELAYGKSLMSKDDPADIDKSVVRDVHYIENEKKLRQAIRKEGINHPLLKIDPKEMSEFKIAMRDREWAEVLSSPKKEELREIDFILESLKARERDEAPTDTPQIKFLMIKYGTILSLV